MSSPPGYRYSSEEISYILRRPQRVPDVKARRKNQSFSSSLIEFLFEYQLTLAIALMLTLPVAYALFPEHRHQTRKFYRLHHYDATKGTYTAGYDDAPFVLLWIVVFTALRRSVMDYILKPLAIMGGVHKTKAKQRFAEQGWLIIYYVLSFGIGLYIWSHSKYWLNNKELWTDFPEPEMSYFMKWYYLVQFGFWLQQIIVVNEESMRNDYWQMLTHHFVTCTLLFTSYSFYMTRVGNVILTLMDVADIILSSAKVLRYLAYQTACDAAFGIFIITWFITRHIFYPIVIWSVWTDLPKIMPLGCYSSATREKLDQPMGTHIGHYVQPFYEKDGVVCFDKRVHWHFLTLLIFLECIILVWFGMIVRVAWKVVNGHSADDTRSDDEDEGDDAEEAKAALKARKAGKKKA